MYLIYKKNDNFVKELAGLHDSCFGKNPLEQFKKEGYECEIVDDATFFKLISTETRSEKIIKLKDQLISTRKNFLSKTDWHCLKEIDLPNSYPEEIKNKRIRAWQQIDEIEASNTLGALNQFSADLE